MFFIMYIYTVYMNSIKNLQTAIVFNLPISAQVLFSVHFRDVI